MSVFYRKEYYREKLFLNSLHLKACRKKLQEILPYKCSKIDYIQAFKECFPHIWEDIVFFCKIRKNDYYRRKKKGFVLLSFTILNVIFSNIAHTITIMRVIF